MAGKPNKKYPAFIRNKDWLIEQYFDKHLPFYAIGREHDVPTNVIKYWFNKHGLKARPVGGYSGKHSASWKGGKRKTAQGYIAIYCPEHPSAWPKTNCVFEHRLVMEEHIGRCLENDEEIHHKNGNRSDNRIENLELRVGHHGPGQSVNDMIEYSVKILRRYAPHLLKKGAQ